MGIHEIIELYYNNNCRLPQKTSYWILYGTSDGKTYRNPSDLDTGHAENLFPGFSVLGNPTDCRKSTDVSVTLWHLDACESRVVRVHYNPKVSNQVGLGWAGRSAVGRAEGTGGWW